jgi:DNA-binding MarR family transcriptional regulator
VERIPFETIPPVLRDRVGYLISRLHMASHAAANHAVERYGDFSIKHQACLRVIETEGPISQQALSARTGVDRSTMVTLVDELEAAGFVMRTRNPADRRAYALEITDPGRAWIDQTAEALTEAEEDIFEPLDQAERDQLRALLLKLVTGEAVKSEV